MCAKHGIYAASQALRHADIAITSQHYIDKKRRTTVGMGHLLIGGAATHSAKVPAETAAILPPESDTQTR